jgi:hypothetical protein
MLPRGALFLLKRSALKMYILSINFLLGCIYGITYFLVRGNNKLRTKGHTGLVKAQAVRRPFLTAAARVQAQARSVKFVVDKGALGQVFSEYFGFLYQFAFHRLLHTHHQPSFGAVNGQCIKWSQPHPIQRN